MHRQTAFVLPSAFFSSLRTTISGPELGLELGSRLRIRLGERTIKLMLGHSDLNGRTSFDVKNKDEFFRFFQIKKELRKNIDKIELDFNYDLNEEKITFDNLRIDNN